jgi:hypothetical protein
LLEAAIESVPVATETDIAGASWSLRALAFKKNPVLKLSAEGPWFLTYTVTGNALVLLENTAWSTEIVFWVPPLFPVELPMNPMT